MTKTTFESLRDSLPAALARAGYAGFAAKPNPGADMGDDSRILILTRPAGLDICLTTSRYQNLGKVRVSHIAPLDNSGRALYWGDYMPRNRESFERAKAPEINVSLDKTPDQISRDIARRLLSQLDAAWPIFERIMGERAAATVERDRALAAIKAMGGTWRESPHHPIGPGDTVYCDLPMGRHGTLSFEVRPGGHIYVPHFGPDLDLLRALVAASKES